MTTITISSILNSPASHWLSGNEPSPGGFADSESAHHLAHKFEILGEMTGGIAHDIRNLFAVLDASLRLIERNIEDPNAVYSYTCAAREAVRRGVMLTSQLTDFVRAPGPGLEVCAGAVNEYLVDLEPLLRYSAGVDHPIILDLQPNLPPCRINRTQFDMAVLNLVNNSRDASGSGAEIHIVTDMVDTGFSEAVRVRVEDYGSGMAPETLSHIFEPCFTTKGDRGTGIGLPQIHAAMKLVGGYVNVTSELGHGTIVDLLFPAVEPVAQRSPAVTAVPNFAEAIPL
jgi:signal transduction histidine kinase